MEQQIRPLVTMRILSYNHEAYIAKAIEGAFSQTYSPLEIIISDDASTDRTWEIILQRCKEYSGPHTVVTNRNSKNLGVAQHLDMIQSISNGLISVGAAGDDISYPDRVEKIVNEFVKYGWKLKSFFSNAIVIDNIGNESGLYFKKKPKFYQTIEEVIIDHKSLTRNIRPFDIWQLGATSAFHRDLYCQFKSVDGRSLQDDGVYAFRALLLGGIGYIDKPLVGYRRHSESISSLSSPRAIKKFMTRQKYYKFNQLCDAVLISPDNKELIRIMRLRYRLSEIKSTMFSLPLFSTMYYLLRRCKLWFASSSV